jgi:glycosyltransferase involved in cell wall biosynthesis
MIIGIDASRANKPIKTGVEWYAYHLIENFKKIDQKNQYFLYSRERLTGELLRLPENFKFVQLRWWPRYFWTLIRLSWNMKFGRPRLDVLFVPAHTLPLVSPERSIVTVHDIGFARFPDLYKWTARLYHEWSTRFVKKHAKKIITVSEFCKREIVEVYGYDPAKIAVVYNGYNSHAYRESTLDPVVARQKLVEKWNLVDPYFMFVGRLEAKKNIWRLVKAFLEFKKIHPDDKHKLVLVGKPGYGFTEVFADLLGYGANTDVLVMDYLNENDIAALLNLADLFVFPSLYEGFGIPVIEAMASGAPVICSNTTSLPEVVGEAAIKFNPENLEAMIHAMELVAFNDEVRQALITKGYEQAKKFSWEKCARETLKVLEAE